MIGPHVLTMLMWSVIAIWALTAIMVLAEFRVRSRRIARASALLAHVTSDDRLTSAMPAVTRSQFQELVHAGLPQGVEAALARQLRSQEGDTALFSVATAAAPAAIEERIQALQVLVSGRHPGMYIALAGALRVPNWETATAALRLLKELDNESSARVLVDALADGAHSPARIAAALDLMTTDRGPLLGPLLKHSSQTVRFWTLLLIGRTAASEWTPDVRDLTTDRAPMVRRAAVEALGRIGLPDDRRLVLARLLDPAAMVRVHAARAAAAFPDSGTASAVARLLSDREWIVRAAARDSLRKMGDVAMAGLIRTLWTGDAFAANNAAEVLFLTGATIQFVEDLLERPGDREQMRLVERLMTASGPQIERAVHDQLEPGRQSELQRLLDEVRAADARVRTR